jgi:hypothetical protein
VTIVGTRYRLLRIRSTHVARHAITPPYPTQKNRLTLTATKHASFYMSNSSADRNCHTLLLPFDLH